MNTHLASHFPFPHLLSLSFFLFLSLCLSLCLSLSLSLRSTVSLANPKVFFDINVGDKDAGRVIFELFADVVPKTVRKFLSLSLILKTLSIRRLKTSVPYVLVRKDLATKEANSIVLFLNSCAKGEISL
jgi:hypothetical protein